MKRRIENSVSAGSMADIAFLLLIFFLVTTTIEEPEGLQVLLPHYEESPVPNLISEERVLSISLNGKNELLIESEIVTQQDLNIAVVNHINSILERKEQPIISLMTHQNTSYEIYIHAYDQIKRSYTQLRDAYAHQRFQKNFNQLNSSDRKSVVKAIPMIISEAEFKPL